MATSSSMSRTGEQESAVWFRYSVQIEYELRTPVLDLIELIDRLDSVVQPSDEAGRKYAAALRGAARQALGVIDQLLASVNAYRVALEQDVPPDPAQMIFNAHVAEAAHDINGSLGVLMGYAELLALRTESANPTAHTIAQAIVEGINPLSDAVESIREHVPSQR